MFPNRYFAGRYFPDRYAPPGAATSEPAVRSLLARWLGGAASPPAPTATAGFRSLLAFWAGGAVAPPAPANDSPQSLGSYDASGYLYRRRETDDHREELERVELAARDREADLAREAALLKEQLAEADRRAVIRRLRAELRAKHAEQEAARQERERAEAALSALTADRNRTAALNRARRAEEDTFFMLLAA